MTIADLSYWLEKNGKVISVGKLEDIITLYCETEFDNRFD
jgi:pyruvate-formate lyase